MSDFNYLLNKNDYTYKNALFWGNFVKHCKKAREGSLGHRTIHIIIAGFELLPIVTQIASIFEKLIVDHYVLPKMLLEERAQRILELALTSTAIRKLYDQANSIVYKNRTGPWKIKFVKNVNIATCVAACICEERIIKLNSSIPDPSAITYFVFELTNAVSTPRFYELADKALNGVIGCEEFSREFERVEHSGVLLHRQVINEAINEMNWNEQLDIYKDIIPLDFDEFWKIQKDTPHAEHYRKEWRGMRFKRAMLRTVNKIKNFFQKIRLNIRRRPILRLLPSNRN